MKIAFCVAESQQRQFPNAALALYIPVPSARGKLS